MVAPTLCRIIADVRPYNRDISRIGMRAAFWFAFATLPAVALIHGYLYAVPLAMVLFGWAIGCASARGPLFASLVAHEQAYGTLAGFDVRRTFASDLENAAVVRGTRSEVFQRVCAWLIDEGHASFSVCNENSGEIVATVRGYQMSDPHDVFIRLSDDGHQQTKMSTRVVASAISPFPDCFDIESRLFMAAREYAVRKHEKPSLAKYKMPLYLPRLLKSLLIVAVVAWFAGVSGPQTSSIDTLLSAGKYAEAEKLISADKERSVEFEQSLFVALAGQGKYDEAIRILDERDQDTLAFALASKGDIKGAEKALNSAVIADEDGDVGARYLAKSMIALSHGNKAEALEDVAVAKNASTALSGLDKLAEIKVLKELGKVHAADKIATSLNEDRQSALSQVGLDIPALVAWTLGLMAASLIVPAWYHKRWHKTAAALPAPDDIETEVQSNLGLHDSFDRCLMTLAKTGCTITSMDDEHGTVEAVDAEGSQVKVNLLCKDEGVRIRLKTPGTEGKGREWLLRLADQLQEPC